MKRQHNGFKDDRWPLCMGGEEYPSMLQEALNAPFAAEPFTML